MPLTIKLKYDGDYNSAIADVNYFFEQLATKK